MADFVASKDLHRIVMTCIIRKGDTFFVMKRSESSKVFPGKWSVPGGGVEAEEDYLNQPKGKGDAWHGILESALRREVEEETGLRVGSFTYLGNLFFMRPDAIPALVVRFMAEYESGEAKLEEGKFTESAWIRADEVDSYDMLGTVGAEIQEAAKR